MRLYKQLKEIISTNNKHKFACLLSTNKKLKELLLERYGSTSFDKVKERIKYFDSQFLTCPKCQQPLFDCKCSNKSLAYYISFKSLLKWISSSYKYDKSKCEQLLKVAVKRLKRQIPKALTKQTYILHKCGLIEINKCKCGRLKSVNEDICYVCKSIAHMNQTIQKKYGVDNISKLESVKRKKVEKWKQNANKWIEKHKQTVRKKYGVDNVSQIESVKQKKSKTLRKLRLDFERFSSIMNETFKRYGKFGRWNVPQDVYERIKFSNNPYMDYLRILYYERLQIDDRCELITDFEEFMTSTVPRQLKVRCKECGRISTYSIWGLKQTNYLSCKYCNAYTSIAERQLFNWIKSLGLNPMLHYNRGTSDGELDIYIPERNLAIEYQGLVWHVGEEAYQRDKQKWENYTNKGVRIFYVYQDDFEKRNHIIKSMLLHKLLIKQNQRVIYARNCEFVCMTKANKLIQNFFNTNHMHGFVPGQLYGLLIYQNEIIAGMIVSKHRFSKNSTEFEIVRFCTKVGYHIPGAFSKLFSNLYIKVNNKKFTFFVDSSFGSNIKEDIIARYSHLCIKDIELTEGSFYVVDLLNPYKKFHRLYGSKSSMKRFYYSGATQEDLLAINGFAKLWRPPSWKIVLN